MSQATKKKRDILRDRVVDLVIDFINTEGGISQRDLDVLFNSTTYPDSVCAALYEMPINFSSGS